MFGKKVIGILSVLVLIAGCGNNTTSVESKIPLEYSYKVVNNRGLVVEGQLGNYKIKIYSDSNETANPQNIHKGVVVNINGKSSEMIPIEISYLNKNIIVSIYDETGNELAVSEVIKVTDVPVVVIDMSV